MTIRTRRNAIAGWLALKICRIVARRQAKRVGRRVASLRSSQRPAIVFSVLVGLFAAIGAPLLRRRSADSTPD